MTDQTPAEWLADLAEEWGREPFLAISNQGQAGEEFLRNLTALLAKHERDRIRLRDAQSDLLDIRGHLSPNPSAGEGIPAEVCDRLLGERAAPAVEWVVDEWLRLAGESARLRDSRDRSIGISQRRGRENAQIRQELTTATRRLEVAHRREDDLRGAYEAAWAERNEARSLTHAIYAAAADMASRPWSMCTIVDVDPELDRSKLPDWLTDCEPPADPALGAGVGQDGAEGGRERASAAPGDSGTAQTVLEGSTGPTEWTDARDGRTYDLTHDWTDRHGLVWHCDGWHQYWTDPEPRPQMTEGVPGGAMALDDVIDNYGPLQPGDGTERTIIR